MSEAVVSRTLIVLSGATWRAELTDELIRLGVAEDRAPISAGRVLSRICRHQGFLHCFQYDEPEEVDTTEEGGTTRRAVSATTRRKPTTQAVIEP